MHLRKLVLLLGVLSLVVSRSVLALGLGDITLNSSLNQPLDAHIRLLDVGDLGADQIVVKLGSQEDFDRVGLERSFFYSQLRFNVITDSAKGPFIAVTSRDPVREPFLSFIVEVRWTSGRLLREYTVLLDLPTFAEDGAQPVQATATPVRSSTTPVKSEPVRPAQEPGAVSAQTSGGGEQYGPVKANDTLWEIARDYRPGRVSIQQTMLAIQRANPEAFINNNINLLRKGQVLRIPSEQEIRSVTTRQAISEVAQQNREWSGNAMGAQLDASGRGGSVNRSSEGVSGRVKLAAPGTTGDSGSAQGGGYGSSNGGATARELAEAEEELERTKSENSDLRSRVSDLEGQIETMERLLEVSNEQLRALELAANDPEATAADGGTDSAQQGSQSETGEQAPASPTADEETDPVAEETQEAAEEPEPAEPAREVNRVVRSAPEPTLMDKVMDNILWIALAVIGLIVAVFVALRRRSGSQEQEEFTSEFDGDVFAEPETDDAKEEEDTTALDLDDDFESEFADADEGPAEAETGDVVSEADIYIAYGKYDQAEEMLLKGLEKEPGSMAIKLKLLELYAESGDLSAFDERYGDVLASGDESAIARARDLRAQFSDAPEYVAAAGAAAAAAAVATQNRAQDDEVFELDLEPASQADDEDFTLELDDGGDELTLDDLDIEPESSQQSNDADDELTLEDDFDFDLSDDDESTESSAATDEVDLEGSHSRYDLSFDERADSGGEDDELLDFDLELDDEETAPKADEPSTSADDELSLDDLSLTLDEPETAEAPTLELEPEKTDESSEDDFDFDLESLDEAPSAEKDKAEDAGEVALNDEAPLLDEDLDFSFEESTGEDDEPELETAYSEPEPYAPSAAPSGADEEPEPPTLDLAEDDADDFDLDQAMGDLDLEALDREMADLDAPEPEPLAQPESEAPQAKPQTDAGADAFDVSEDDTFDEALEGVDDSLELDDLPSPESVNEPGDDDEDLDFLADADEVATKLDLARAYIDMGDMDGARDILSEVTEEGNEQQRQDAQALLEKVDS